MGLSIEPITIAGEREILFPTSTTRFTGSPRSTALRLLFDQRSEWVARRSFSLLSGARRTSKSANLRA